ncbi:hypothetical protein CC85DRAFT_314202 [Cutaneotrichosporon oleaginosum]|uniref:Uncharacterized protein n=1 Tax=Cutaneotrichosporon oleaginosum TaxID=879819 RepID=A0A0J0XCM9_9TREE|nr:uncharacterized protein CC85DRAFT_314202 [Cutaneotrichosporon oleaginosum]KLT38821.1 hypothetical protein CC85DRAFT_314202 [Cutaneotrichosporon oleaginosum]TXT04734.1 hypothetical protein COLE_07553 [Cutaneotrichosporon oleaginosum]
MSREDDEATVDTLLRHTSPPAPATTPGPSEPAGRAAQAPQSRTGLAEGAEVPPSAREGSRLAPPSLLQPASLPEPSTMPGEPDDLAGRDLNSNLEEQRRERAERLRAAEEAQDVLAPEAVQSDSVEASSASALQSDMETNAVEEGRASSARAENKPEMADGLEGLRRRRPEGAEARPPESTTTATDFPHPAVESVKREAARSASGTTTPAGDEQQCRICFGGREEEMELGRLISPCLCAGSMRYVHVKCINQWRGTGANAKTFMECPQCHHQYSIRRTLVSGLATSKPILLLVTTILFLFITFISGHVLLRYLVVAAEVAAEAEKASTAVREADTKVGGMTRHGDVWESEDGSVIIAAPGLTLIYDVIVEAVDIFLDLAAAAYDMWPRSGRSFHTRASRLALSAVIRLILGLSVLGSLSFLSLLASLSLFAPLQLAYTIFGTGVFRGPLDNLRRRAPNADGILVIIAVAIGVANSVVSVYDVVRAVARKLLSYVETQILEVNPEQARLAREAAARQPHWFDEWVAQRRWRRLAGWYEVFVRLWEWVKDRWRAGVAAVKASVEARVHAAERARGGAEDVLVG